jgi:hypothetical protein
MKMKIKMLLTYPVWLGLLLLACGGISNIATPDLVATEVAVKKAAAATLTAEAPPVVSATTETTIPTPPPASSPTSPLAAGDTPTVASPTDTPVPLTLTPTPTPVAVAPTPTPPLRVDVPVDGGQSDLKGQIVIPGFRPDELKGPEFGGVIFRDRLVFRVEVYDPKKGSHDGAGIDKVKITITGPHGDTVHERTEGTAGYCVFGGGEPDCNVFDLTTYDRWPEQNHLPLETGLHSVSIEITTKSNKVENWMWSFWIQRQK